MPRYFKEEPKKNSNFPNDSALTVLSALGGHLHEPIDSKGFNYNYQYPEVQMTLSPGKEVPLVVPEDYEREYDLGHRSAERTKGEMVFSGYPYPDPRIDEAADEQRNRPQMFHHRPTLVHGLFADPSMQHAVPTLLGLAINQFGPTLQASSNLSRHSSRVVKRGMEAGVVLPHPRNPSAEGQNNIDFIPRTQTISSKQPNEGLPAPYYTQNIVELPDSEVDAARRTIKGIIRPKTRSAQFDALDKLESDRDKPYNPETDPNAMRIPGM